MPAPTRCWCSGSARSWPSMDAEEFVADVLGRRIGAAGVVTGDDFSFGKGRSGDVALLKQLGERHDIIAEAVSQVLLDGERVSRAASARR